MTHVNIKSARSSNERCFSRSKREIIFLLWLLKIRRKYHEKFLTFLVELSKTVKDLTSLSDSFNLNLTDNVCLEFSSMHGMLAVHSFLQIFQPHGSTFKVVSRQVAVA